MPQGRKADGIEIYSSGRVFVMTGNDIDGTPTTIENAQDAVDELWGYLTAKQGGPPGKAVMIDWHDIGWGADPETIRDRVEELLASDPEFRRTWEHDRPDLADQSLSSYDLSLLSQAVSVHQWSDPTDLYLLLRLHREEHGSAKDKKKAKRKHYVCRTIGRALAGVQDNGDTKVLIKLQRGGIASAIDEVAAVLGDACRSNPFNGVYRYGDQLVLVTRMHSSFNDKEA